MSSSNHSCVLLFILISFTGATLLCLKSYLGDQSKQRLHSKRYCNLEIKLLSKH